MPERPSEGNFYTGPKRPEPRVRAAYTTRREQSRQRSWERQNDPVRRLWVAWNGAAHHERAEFMALAGLTAAPEPLSPSERAAIDAQLGRMMEDIDGP